MNLNHKPTYRQQFSLSEITNSEAQRSQKLTMAIYTNCKTDKDWIEKYLYKRNPSQEHLPENTRVKISSGGGHSWGLE